MSKMLSLLLGNTPAEAMAFLKVEIARWGKVIKMANVKVD
jgi:hypothetical protein